MGLPVAKNSFHVYEINVFVPTNLDKKIPGGVLAAWYQFKLPMLELNKTMIKHVSVDT